MTDDSEPYLAAEVVRKKPLPAFALRPGALTAVCVLSIVLGFMAIAASLNLVAAIVINQMGGMGALLGPGFGGGGEIGEAQAEFQAQIAAVQNEYVVVEVIVVLSLMILAIALLVGGFKSMGLSESGRRILATTCLAAVGLELLRAVYHVILFSRTMPLTAAFIERIPMGGLVQASTYMGIAVQLGWVLLKLGFYLYAAHYLRKPDIRAIFDKATT